MMTNAIEDINQDVVHPITHSNDEQLAQDDLMNCLPNVCRFHMPDVLARYSVSIKITKLCITVVSLMLMYY